MGLARLPVGRDVGAGAILSVQADHARGHGGGRRRDRRGGARARPAAFGNVGPAGRDREPGGAAHILGAQAVAKAAPDGHTLLVAEAGTFVLNPTIYAKEKLAYDTEKDLLPITGLVRINQALIANNALAVNNVRELIELANKRPGEITYGTAGVGSAPHVNIVKFENMAHVKLQPIHYRGAAPALNDIMAGHINLMSVSYSLVVQPFAEKKLKVLAVGGLKRSPQLPNSPTVDESGVPGYG